MSFDFLRATLKKIAKLHQLEKDSKADSVTILNLKAAFFELQVSLEGCQKAVDQGARISADDAEMLQLAGKEIRRLKRLLTGNRILKWTGWGVAVVFAYLAVKSD